ncbi:unnamed protein product [Brassica rapa subsp. trilocularis]
MFHSRRETAKRGAVSRRLVNEYIQEGGIDSHTMRDLVASIRVVGTEDFVCEEVLEEPTLLVTRFEYANMFHAVTDWYSAYVSSRVTGLPNRPHVVFIDGHCTVCSSSCSYSVSFTQLVAYPLMQTQLEETWTALFSGIRYAKNFSKPVCFRHVVLSPLGYETALVKGLSAFGFPVNRHRSSETSSSSSPLHNVLFVCREDYLAHPRHGVKAIQDASVIIGAHGAGLTHIVSATPNTRIFEIVSVEFQSPHFEPIVKWKDLEFQRPHFELIAKWKGLEYHAMHLANSRADPTAVIEKLKEIMKSFGC